MRVKRLGALEHDLRVHRPAFGRQRVREHHRGARVSAGRSISASSGPAGPGISRTMSANALSASFGLERSRTPTSVGERGRPRDRARDGRCARASPTGACGQMREILAGQPGGTGTRRARPLPSRSAPATWTRAEVGLDPCTVDQLDPSSHPSRAQHVPSTLRPMRTAAVRRARPGHAPPRSPGEAAADATQKRRRQQPGRRMIERGSAVGPPRRRQRPTRAISDGHPIGMAPAKAAAIRPP